MKPVFIILIAVVCAVIVLFGLSVYSIENVGETKLTPFNCAEVFDNSGFVNSNQNYKTWGKAYVELMDNRCFLTVESWAHESDLLQSGEYLTSGISNWKQYYRINETYLGEFYCRDLKCQAEIDTILDIKKTLE
ncbi:MAG: hypothetical protein MT335_03630 [Candidatus Nitrosopumilus limneticus]|nr:hypothetical protein [Candidatus Nitrosopumilus limneticus]